MEEPLVPRAVWNEVSTDFDPEEETANFGTRHALESGESLYEVGDKGWKYRVSQKKGGIRKLGPK